MHAAFLQNRYMRVKVGNTLSSKKSVTGGAVQGSVLGVMDHNAVMEVVDDDFLTDSHKYVDDLTATEVIGREAGSYNQSGALTGERDIEFYHASRSEENIKRISDYCLHHGLKVNEKKTQLLAISSKKNRVKVWIQAGRENINSTDSLKLLGFVFGEKPDVTLQVENLIARASRRMFVLRYYSRFMPGKDLIKLYSAMVRSVLEYSSVTYHSMLTIKQSNDLEQIQKKCLRCIFGYGKGYEELLEESGLSTLKARREKAVLKFAAKTAKNPVYSHWFLLNPNHTSSRNPKIYTEEFARTSRLYNSPLFHMRRLLNKTDHDQMPETNYMDLAHLFDDDDLQI